MKDTPLQSLYKGRYLSALLALASAGLGIYGVSEAQQAELMQVAISALGGGAALVATISKLRQKK